MPVAAYSKALREPIHFLWERRKGSKLKAATYCSKGALGIRPSGGRLIYDHAIPFRYLQQELLGSTDVTALTVRGLLDRFGVTVLITEDENRRLCAAGLASRMPADWDGQDPFARMRTVGIEVVENNVAEQRTPLARRGFDSRS